MIARAKAIDMRVTAASRLLVEGPQQVVASVIGNLLRNAVEYTDEGQVEVQIGPGEVVIEDSGIGMQASDLDDAFKRYARADSNRRGGHGVGLTIVKRFADRFGWDRSLVRLLFVLSFLLPGPQILVYLVLWVLMPEEG